MSLHSSSLESVRLSFYCNSHTAILNPHQPQEKQRFSESFWGAFFQKGAVHAFCVAEKAGSSALLNFVLHDATQLRTFDNKYL